MSNNGNGNGNGNGNHDDAPIQIHDMPDLDVRSEREDEIVQPKKTSKPFYTKTGSRRLSGQILSPPVNIDEAMAWTALNLKNNDEVRKCHAILNALAHCEEFNITCGIEEIRRYLILMPAAGGWGRALAAMIETGIIVPSGLGVSRNTEEEIQKAVKKKQSEEESRRED